MVFGKPRNQKRKLRREDTSRCVEKELASKSLLFYEISSCLHPPPGPSSTELRRWALGSYRIVLRARQTLRRKLPRRVMRKNQNRTRTGTSGGQSSLTAPQPLESRRRRWEAGTRPPPGQRSTQALGEAVGELCLCSTRSHWSEWLSFKSLQTINAGEGVEKRELSYSVGENANWYSHYGEQCGHSFKNWK